MEDDDEFGDLYTDVLRPLAASGQSQYQEIEVPVAVSHSVGSHNRRIDLNGDSNSGRTLHVASDVKSGISNCNAYFGLNFNSSIQENAAAEVESRSEVRRFDLNLKLNQGLIRPASFSGNGNSDNLELKARVLAEDDGVNLREMASVGFNFMEEDNDINIVVEEEDNKDDDLVEKDNNIIDQKDNLYVSAGRKENAINIVGENMVQDKELGQKIPGLAENLENHGTSNFEDEWESEESEDDLQIVLNDNSHGPIGMERIPGMHDEDDEDGEPLVIVADNGDVGHHHLHQQIMMMEEQEWVGEEGGPGADGEKKELGDTSKASGAGGTTTPAAVQPRVGYSNHMYHHPFHSQFKYVRPGAPPLPGASPITTPGGIPGQVRPPVTMGPVAGRGRGDWRPAGPKGAVPVQKGFPGYGTPIWGTNLAGRGYGSGLDFTLPSHKTIFEVDIDSFEDKPWNFPGIEKSDFFNFDLNEDSWKDYCKQLEQLRLETTMQSKIRVYESGRTEQDYDPDLPPELAAAVSVQDIPSEKANPGNSDAVPIDLTRECGRERPPLPIGRPIPVETGSGDRLPSTDTRRLRVHDSDAIIEIVCHSSRDDDDVAEHKGSDLAAEDPGEGCEVDYLQQEDREHINGSSVAYNGKKREHIGRGVHHKNIVSGDESVREKGVPLPSEESEHYYSDRDFDGPQRGRSKVGREFSKSPEMTVSDNGKEKETVDYHKEDSLDSGDGKQSPCRSSHAIESDDEQDTVLRDEVNDKTVMDDKNFDEETNKMDAISKNTLEDKYLMHSSDKKKKASSCMEQSSQENDGGKDPKAVRSSESSKARSASSKDHRKLHDSVEDEVIQEKYHPRSGNIKRLEGDHDNARRKGHYEKVETDRHHLAMRGKEDSYSHRGVDPDSSLRWHVKSGSSDWRKENDISEGSWHQRDEDLLSRRIDTTKRERGGETGSRSWGKSRESERSEKDEHKQSRKQLDNGSWRGAYRDQETGPRQKDRDDYQKIRNEKMDDLHRKRRKEDVQLSRDYTVKEGLSYSHRESSSRRKRERDDESDKRDDRARLKDSSLHHPRQKEEPFQRERSERRRESDEWHRLKQSHEEIFSRREREEARPAMRSGRVAEEKAWMSNSRGKNDYTGSNKEYLQEDLGRHSEQSKRRDRVENESFSQLKDHENVYARGNQLNNDEKRVRSERSGPRDERDAFGSDPIRTNEHKHKESSGKNRESKSGDHDSLIPSKRIQGDHSRQISKTVNIRAKTGQETGRNEIQSSGKHKEEVSSDDEQPGSRRGRSKFERWTSHQEREFYSPSMQSSSLNSKDLEMNKKATAPLGDRFPEEASKKEDDKPCDPSVNDKDTVTEMNNIKEKVEDKHLDTVEKLKKRSERFKLPMPSEKDAQAIKKLENGQLNSSQTENPPDSEIKSERPARKRRWTSS